ncbi:hypothetical protein ACH4RG_23170 [Streptomyces sp. NPDC021019]|uniref:hypothetical protein n=1 Tax=Streptomyces sp. NPDC021019 TaxID=3365108 RepID=UPI00378D222A
MQHLRELADKIPTRSDSYAVHTVAFIDAHTGLDLVNFMAQGAIAIPTPGQLVTVHNVKVVVTEVETAYEAAEDGRPAVHNSVWVVAPAKRD